VGREQDVTLTLTAATANVVAQLLEFLSGLPSTPDIIAAEAHEHAAHLEEALPPPRRHPRPGARSLEGVVVLEQVPATAIAGMLELLAELPSTPPAVADEARAHAERFWNRLSEAAKG
jgi:hypothetical protein